VVKDLVFGRRLGDVGTGAARLGHWGGSGSLFGG
jgi:hypothetical protein